MNFLCTELYNNLTSTLLVDVKNRTHSTRLRTRLYSDIPQLDAPVIYTGAFPFLTARPGRRSIYNKTSFFSINDGLGAHGKWTTTIFHILIICMFFGGNISSLLRNPQNMKQFLVLSHIWPLTGCASYVDIKTGCTCVLR